jgi:hypothetical protein
MMQSRTSSRFAMHATQSRIGANEENISSSSIFSIAGIETQCKAQEITGPERPKKRLGGMSVWSRRINMVDHQNIDTTLAGFKFQAQLLFESRKDGGAGVGGLERLGIGNT